VISGRFLLKQNGEMKMNRQIQKFPSTLKNAFVDKSHMNSRCVKVISRHYEHRSLHRREITIFIDTQINKFRVKSIDAVRLLELNNDAAS
jgi:hypothetical protein